MVKTKIGKFCTSGNKPAIIMVLLHGLYHMAFISDKYKCVDKMSGQLIKWSDIVCYMFMPSGLCLCQVVYVYACII